MRDSVYRALREYWIVEQGNPFFNGAVAGDDGAAAFMAFDDDFVEVTGLLRVQAFQAKIVNYQEVWCQEAAEASFGAVVRAALVEGFEEGVAAEAEYFLASPAGGMADGCSQDASMSRQVVLAIVFLGRSS